MCNLVSPYLGGPVSRGMKPTSRLLLIWMEDLKRCSAELAEGYGVLIFTMVLEMSVSCFAGSRMTHEALLERSHTERGKAETLGTWQSGSGYSHSRK